MSEEQMTFTKEDLAKLEELLGDGASVSIGYYSHSYTLQDEEITSFGLQIRVIYPSGYQSLTRIGGGPPGFETKEHFLQRISQTMLVNKKRWEAT